MLIYVTSWGKEYVSYKKGKQSLEKYTDSRIMSIYRETIAIYKLYDDHTCICLKETRKG